MTRPETIEKVKATIFRLFALLPLADQGEVAAVLNEAYLNAAHEAAVGEDGGAR